MKRTIAVEVFGRPAESDLGEDTIVRVSAREVRKRLAQYYTSPDGTAADLRVDLPSGSYAPEFRYNVAPVPAPPAEPEPAPPAVVVRSWRRRAAIAGIVLAVAAAAVFALLQLAGGNSNSRAFQQFWAPVLNADEPLLVAVAHPIVYHASGRAHRLNQETSPPAPTPLQRPLQLPPEKLTGGDFVPVFNQYVGFGDMVVATEISSMLAARSRSVAGRRSQPAFCVSLATRAR